MNDANDLLAGLTGEATAVVSEAMTAPRVGSGSVAVLATPMMVALMEAAAVACVEAKLEPGTASLGTHIDVSHSAPTPVGGRVTTRARLEAVEGRTLTFAVTAEDDHGPIGSGTHVRVVVDVARFTAKLALRRKQGV